MPSFVASRGKPSLAVDRLWLCCGRRGVLRGRRSASSLALRRASPVGGRAGAQLGPPRRRGGC
eukprot:10881616-Lingulodinium_polyedra.AAC.1